MSGSFVSPVYERPTGTPAWSYRVSCRSPPRHVLAYERSVPVVCASEGPDARERQGRGHAAPFGSAVGVGPVPVGGGALRTRHCSDGSGARGPHGDVGSCDQLTLNIAVGGRPAPGVVSGLGVVACARGGLDLHTCVGIVARRTSRNRRRPGEPRGSDGARARPSVSEVRRAGGAHRRSGGHQLRSRESCARGARLRQRHRRGLHEPVPASPHPRAQKPPKSSTRNAGELRARGREDRRGVTATGWPGHWSGGRVFAPQRRLRHRPGPGRSHTCSTRVSRRPVLEATAPARVRGLRRRRAGRCSAQRFGHGRW